MRQPKFLTGLCAFALALCLAEAAAAATHATLAWNSASAVVGHAARPGRSVCEAGACLDDPPAAGQADSRANSGPPCFEDALAGAGCTPPDAATVQLEHTPGYEWNVAKRPVGESVWDANGHPR